MRQLIDGMQAASADLPPTAVDIEKIIASHLRRRNRRRLLVVGGLVVLAAGAAPVLATAGEPAPDRTASAPPTDPVRQSLWTDRARETARAAVPAGAELGDEPIEYWGGQEFQLMWANLTTAGGGRTQLFVFLELDQQITPTEDVCAVPPLESRFAGEEVACATTTVDGLVLRVASARDTLPGTPEHEFTFEIVSRYGSGWAVHVWELPYRHPMPEGSSEPERVDRPVFTTRQLAELAADPDLVP
jgi:hypothetical protein